MTRNLGTSNAQGISDRDEDVLCSDANGVYDISFFSASVDHSAEHSKKVYAKFSGGMLSSFAPAWSKAPTEEKRAFLLEHHETAHHALMFSTPVGVLNWRLNQTIQRDIQWILIKCEEYSIVLSEIHPPRNMLVSAKWQSEFMARPDGIVGAEKEYLLYVIDRLENLIRLRSIFFEVGAAKKHADLTFSDMCSLLNRVSVYLTERCEVGFTTAWRTRLPPETKVFPAGGDFNVTDIAECHALAQELFILRALNDDKGLATRLEECRQGPFGEAVKIAIERTKGANSLGFSPHQMQVMALLACCSAVESAADVSAVKYVEDELPWWKFCSADIFTMKSLGPAVTALTALTTQPLFGAGSHWIRYPAKDAPMASEIKDNDDVALAIDNIFGWLPSFGLDSQAFAIHEGAYLNLRFLLTLIDDTVKKGLPPGFERLDVSKWRELATVCVPLIEYADNFSFHGFDIEKIFKPGSPVRSLPIFRKCEDLHWQLIAQIVTGATIRYSYAAYAGKLLPNSTVLEEKFSNYFSNSPIGSSICSFLSKMLGDRFIETKYLRFLPDTVKRNRFI